MTGSNTYFTLPLRAIVSVLASFGVMWALCTHVGADPSPAVLSAALAVTLSRSTEPFAWRTLLNRLLALPVVALGAGIVGLTFRLNLPLAAALFCGCIALSIWLRRFGRTARAFGRIIALPFVAMLAVPVHVNVDRPGTGALLVFAAGVVAVACDAAALWVSRALGVRDAEPAPDALPRAKRPGRIDPSTRMALQMFVALALAFVAGTLLLGQHWFWAVLTAFIVCSGAIARGDAIYKAILRLGGAIAGTVVAALLTPLATLAGPLRAGTIFFVLFLAMWLRQKNYAYWAAGATLIFALLQANAGMPALPLFAERVAGIFIGALCAVAATWFVLPVRSEQLLRRRAGDVMAAHKRNDSAQVERLLVELDRAAAPLRLHRRVFGRMDDDGHPAAIAERTREFVRARANATAVMERKVAVTISVAMTIDGYIDDRSAERLVLSSPDDMDDVREERARVDAVLVGAQTVRSDNPSLRKAPARVTVTQSGALDPDARFFDGSARTIVLAASAVAPAVRERLGERAEVHALDDLSPQSILDALHRSGVRSLLIEGGTRILTAFLAAGTFDHLRLAIAPFFAGEQGGARIVEPATFADGPGRRLVLKRVRSFGDMAVLDYERQA